MLAPSGPLVRTFSVFSTRMMPANLLLADRLKRPWQCSLQRGACGRMRLAVDGEMEGDQFGLAHRWNAS